jgi:hypothetical protein
MYPPAYVSVGKCITYALTLDIDWVRLKEDFTRQGSSVEIEEQRRTWWALFVIERSA